MTSLQQTIRDIQHSISTDYELYCSNGFTKESVDMMTFMKTRLEMLDRLKVELRNEKIDSIVND